MEQRTNRSRNGGKIAQTLYKLVDYFCEAISFFSHFPLYGNYGANYMKLNNQFFGSSTTLKLHTILTEKENATLKKKKGKMQEKEMQKGARSRPTHRYETVLMGKISSEHRQA